MPFVNSLEFGFRFLKIAKEGITHKNVREGGPVNRSGFVILVPQRRGWQ